MLMTVALQWVKEQFKLFQGSREELNLRPA